MVQNKALIFKKVPTAWPVPGEHLAIEDRPLDIDASPPPEGIITKNIYASFDPYMRGRMRDPSTKSYVPGFSLNAPLQNRSIARVLKSGTPKFAPGDLVLGMLNIEEYSAVSAEGVKGLAKLDIPYGLKTSLFLGALGMPGLTAYSSFYAIGKPKKGETIFISAASGAVGQIVGQLAKHEGLTVIGSVGSDDKLEYIEKELGFDGGFNYKKEKAADALERLCPKGIDIYYENVGGEQLDAAIEAMTDFGRIVACGMISQYNLPPAERYGVKNISQVVSKRLTMQGFIVSDPNMGPSYASEHKDNVSKWIHGGTFKARESVTDGMDNAATGFIGMLKGDNFGKAVLKIADLD